MNEEEKSTRIYNHGLDLDVIEEQKPRKRVMIVDDEPESVRLLKLILINAGFDVSGAKDGSECIRKTAEQHPDLILLDLMMPDLDGWETYILIREISNAPIIFVSAMSAKENVIKGLQIGAEDYLVKPYHPQELIARIEKVLRRAELPSPTHSFVFPDIGLNINVDSREVRLRGKTVYLPKKVFLLLQTLASQAPKMVSNEEIARELWGSDLNDYQKRIKYLIFTLRKNLEIDPSNPKLIMTWGSFGYRLNSDNK